MQPLEPEHAAEPGSAATKTKRVLVITYSQTGQLTRITERLIEPLREDTSIQVHMEVLHPVQPFVFPWSILRFFDAFPESAHLIGTPLEPMNLRGDEDFDLVILLYQVWFLAPSLPITGFLQHPLAKRLLAGKPVVTVIGCRNMWMMAQEKVKQLLTQCGAHLIDNVVLMDRSPTLVTLVTTPWWLLTGKRQLGSLPSAGIDEASIASTNRFGRALRDALHADCERTSGPLLHGLAACEVDPRLELSERAGTRSFYLWGKLVRAFGPPQAALRKPVLLLYIVFLITLILTVVPVSLTVQALLHPLIRNRLAARQKQFESPSGSGRERMKEYGY